MLLCLLDNHCEARIIIIFFVFALGTSFPKVLENDRPFVLLEFAVDADYVAHKSPYVLHPFHPYYSRLNILLLPVFSFTNIM